ncbi:hypothetical protein [Streptomyces uncialis]|uniref:hypothetical protein n=1 Tax=Streptomyces uncialis TaxID=1048205 RepID=UPI0038667AC3|nr:hypothetical protein OG924_37380 [Streptomyces uncialis]
MTHPDEYEVTLSAIARMAGVGRAAVANWRRRHGGPEATGGTDESPLFPRAAAEQWLRDLDKLPQTGPAGLRPPATVTFAEGQAITVYGPELHSPALPGDGAADEEQFGGYIEPDRPDGIPWPTASARIEQPGSEPYEVTDAHVDISGWGGRVDYLTLIWPAERRRALPTTTETTEAQA